MNAASRAPERARPAAPEGSTRLLAAIRPDGRALSLEAHVRRWDRAPLVRGGRGRRAFLEAVAESGLTGRGGAGFPTARKLEAVADRRGRTVVVANGAEGEPPSGKDKVLLAYAPHLVLDGAVLAAQTVGAHEAIVAVGEVCREPVAYAIEERRAARMDDGVSLRAVVVPDTFLAGEESALVRFLDGGAARPTFTPPRPFERGVGGVPTLVQNVETLAHLALLARFGPRWFRSVGTSAEPGSALVTLSGAVREPGVFEVALGTPLRNLLAEAGGPTAELSALLIGGYFGTWVRADTALGLPLSAAGLAPHGAAPGARAIVALPAGSCGVLETARVLRWLAGESAGQCGPCVHGLAAIASDLEQIARGDDRSGAREALLRRLPLVEGRGACHHPDGSARFVASALRVFEHEVEQHVRHARCTSRAERPVLRLPRQERR